MPSARNVTVVMPVYDRARLVTRALDAIAAQTLPPAAVLCVDDASRDDSAAVIAAWAAAHPGVPLTLMHQARNGGPAAARNVGIRAAATPRIAFCDSDDVWHTDALETLVALADAHPAAVLVAGEARVLVDGVPRGRDLLSPYLDRLGADAVRPGASPGALVLTDPVRALLTTSFLPTSATLFDRAAALAIGGMPPFRMGEDWLFFLALAQRGDVVVTRRAIAIHHRHADNITTPAAGALIAAEHLKGKQALLGGDLPVLLSPAHRATLRAEAAARAREWRYFASRAGWRPYLDALRSPVGRRQGGWRQLVTDPRATLRALLS